MTVDKRKQSLYLPDEILEEILTEAGRLDRSISWLVQQAWILSRDQIAHLSSQTAYITRTKGGT